MFTEADLLTLIATLGCVVYSPIIVAMFWTLIIRREVAIMHAKEKRHGEP